ERRPGAALPFPQEVPDVSRRLPRLYMTGRALCVVPAGQDRRLRTATVARLLDAGPDGARVAVVARGTEGARLRLLASTAGDTTLLWRDRAQRLRRQPDLARRGAAELF